MNLLQVLQAKNKEELEIAIDSKFYKEILSRLQNEDIEKVKALIFEQEINRNKGAFLLFSKIVKEMSEIERKINHRNKK